MSMTTEQSLMVEMGLEISQLKVKLATAREALTVIANGRFGANCQYINKENLREIAREACVKNEWPWTIDQVRRERV